MKPVLFVIIDALAAEVVLPAMRQGRLPFFSALAEAGHLRPQCTSIFPSITPAATAALCTGHYPNRSGIPGAFWFDRKADLVAYYGDDWSAIRNDGIDAYLRGFLTGLNYDRLSCPTVFSQLMRASRTAANLNLMWFRGPTSHVLTIPKVFQWATSGELPKTLDGPDLLVIGDFVAHDGRTDTDITLVPAGYGRRYGFSDETTAEAMLIVLAPDATPPDLTIAYFPDNDFTSHDVGPENALPCVEEIDTQLSRLADRYGGVEAFLDRFAILITGDHSQTRNRPIGEAAVDLNELTPGFNVVAGGSTFGSASDVLVGTNMRAANAYFQRPEDDRDLFIRHVLKDERIDQAMWRDEVTGRLHVRTADRGELTFWTDPQGAADDFGGRWTHEGDLATVDGRLEDDGSRITFGEYPNAFERLDTGCFPLAGDLWVTARPGFEFVIPETTTHDGAAHGSLHRLDSTAPLLVGGLDGEVPQTPRIVDMVPMILRHFGLDHEFAVSQSRQTAERS